MLNIILLSLFSFVVLAQADYDGAYVKLPDAEIAKVLKTSSQCIAETGAKSDILEKMTKFELSRDNEVDRKYIYCFLYNSGYADKNGKLLKDNSIALAQLHEKTNQLLAVIDECNSEVTGTDVTYVMFDEFVCYHKKSPIYYTVY